MSSDQDKKKKRRWDVPGGESNAPSTPAPQQNIQQNTATNTASGSNLNAAQLAAAKLQQILAQKGMSVIPDAGATAELEINDYSPDVRALLTRGATHDQIRAETGATILSRGYYLAPGTQSSTERPLYLLISGENAVVVEKAKEKLQEIINKAQTQLTVKVYIGLENSRPEFGLIPRLLGKQGSFVKYINNETGAKIQLHGRGSGYLEPHSKLEAPDALHFVLSAPTQLALDKAKAMAKDLIDHVQRDFAKAYQHPTHVPVHYPAVPLLPYPPPPPGTGVMIPPPTHMYSQMPPPNMFVPVPPITATANVPLYPELKKQEDEAETHAKSTEIKEDTGVSVGPRRPTAADIEQSRSRLVELPDHVYESHSASEDERSDAERMPPPPPVAPGTVSPAKRKRRNSLTHATDDKFPAPKRQKVSSEQSDEESSGDEGASGFKLVNYDETEDDDKYTAPRNKTPFWAAPPPGKPIFSVLGHGDKDEEDDDDDQTPVLGSSSGYKGRDYDKLHSEVMKELGLK